MKTVRKLHSSSTISSLKKATAFSSYKIEQIEELKEVFKMYDRDNTGNITSRTLKFLLRGLGDNVS